MKLHPDLAAGYDALEESEWFPDYAAAREAARRAHAARLQPPDPRLQVEDVRIDGPGGALPLRLYRPARSSSNLPAVLYFHSGGYFMGSIDGDDAICRSLSLEIGAHVVSCGYRLAPEHPYPAAAEDAYAALHWVANGAAKRGIDAARLAVAGRSAGAGLAAGIALRARDENGPAIAYQSLQIPMLDDRMQTRSARTIVDARITNRTKIAGCWDAYAGTQRDRLSPYAAPARADDLRGLPPAFVHVAEYDPLHDEGLEYARRLALAKTPVEVHRSPGVYHNFENVAPHSSAARRAHALWIAALQEALG